jgi:RNA polymerase sigma factor (sigma-70 family)
MSVRSDAELARAWQAGDHTAFAEVYEEYSPSLFGVAMGLIRDRSAAADVVHDTFVRAARRIDGLREPERLRAWLFAILRNEATVLLRGRGRESAEDVASMSEQLAADLPEPHTELSRSELADVVWSAAEALQQRDREVLELHVRAGLEAGDLADALGVTPGHAAVLLSRMRDRMEKAIGALLIARLGRRECGTLDGLLARWDGRFTLDVRSRVTRHVESCPVCTQGRLHLASYQRLAPAVLPVFLVPEGLRDQVLGSLDLVSTQTVLGQTAGGGPDSGGPDSGGPGGGAGDRDAWSWRDDGFPEPQPTRPAASVAGPEPDDDASGGLVGGGTLAAGAGAGLLAAGLDRHGRQDAADAWSPPGPDGPVPRPRGGSRTGLLVAGAVVVLVVAGIATWKVIATISSDGSGLSAASSAGAAGVSGGGATTDPLTGSTDGATTDPLTGSTDGATGPATGSPTTSATASSSLTSGATARGATAAQTTPTTRPTASSPGTTPSAAPVASAAHLKVGATRLTFGPGRSGTSTARSVTVTNDGGQPLTWTALRSGANYSVSPTSGSLPGGGSTTVTITLNRGKHAEGAVNGEVEFSATPTGQNLLVTLRGSVANPPVISDAQFESPLAVASAAATCRSQTSTGSVAVVDDTGIESVDVQWNSGKGTLSPDGRYYGSFGPFSTMGEHSATIIAYDTLGNSSSLVVPVTVLRC